MADISPKPPLSTSKHTLNHKLVLASSSLYRRQLLDKLKIPYHCHAPDIDESPLADESPEQLVLRLALAKARAAAISCPKSLIIGSDQVAILAGEIVTKPSNYQQARTQLQRASGQPVVFLTSICLLNTINSEYQLQTVPYTVNFLTLTDSQIEGLSTKRKAL